MPCWAQLPARWRRKIWRKFPVNDHDEGRVVGTVRFKINFASQPYQQVQRFMMLWRMVISGVALVSVALVCVSITAYLSWQVKEQQARELRRQISEYDNRKAEVETFLNRRENSQTRQRAEFLNSMIARKAFSWTEVFTDLERVVPRGLHVKSIHPEVNGYDQLELHLVVSGSTRGAAIEVVRRLELSPLFAQPRIESEATQDQGRASDDLVQYTITAVYIPGFARDNSAARKKVASRSGESLPSIDSREPEVQEESRHAGH